MTAARFIAIAAVAVLSALSLWANGPFSALDRLPMQWSLSGEVNWSAPRPLALAFVPVLAAILMAIDLWVHRRNARLARRNTAIHAVGFLIAYGFYLGLLFRFVPTIDGPALP
ncbi:hypothetical protein FV222_20140 [Methylobacterium sp. WL103]|uniref:hypothetical protein n=1 Tax=unclassified Methylobacterium TaxID=2615210 RepID=UPI0011C7B896|nr:MULTISPECIES: hypothetical protein [unclassified Methylobacterium]TXM67598.1 hypothetical protein FV226_21535 [Methylobacterium sp. WL12]TXM95744.1 hypothetical protein FV222_20140 [Methylobacterium sp. WL103]